MRVSVVLCTHNPRVWSFDQALASLARQSLREFELVVVDNASTPPLSLDHVRAPFASAGSIDVRLTAEPRPGLTGARCRGIAETTGDLIVFVDDDNALDADYLEAARAIAAAEPEVGAFGGVARASAALRIDAWKQPLVGHLGIRDNGPTAITSREPHWGPWEPIGAGMVTRRAVAEQFARTVAQQPGSSALGRRGAHQMSGDDALMAHASYARGYSCSYQPALKLTHLIEPSRLDASMLARTIYGHGRSHVILERVLGRPVERPGLAWILTELPKRLAWRCRKEGVPAGMLSWCWDLGYARQARSDA